jgi:hypothetical protein
MATDIFRSAARGVVGAMAMTGVRTLAGGAAVVQETPPEAIAEEVAGGFLAAVRPERREAAVESLHWAVGAGGGAIFGMLPAAARSRPWIGAAYGLGMWFGFEAVIAPVLGLGRHQQKRAGERLVLAADHLLYGLVLSGTRRPQSPAGEAS